MPWTRNDISRKLTLDHLTLKRFVAEWRHAQVCANEGTLRKVSAKEIDLIQRAAATRPLQSSRQIFERQSVGSSRDLGFCIHLLTNHCSQTEMAAVGLELFEHTFLNSTVHRVHCNPGLSRWLDWWMANKTATSATMCWSHVVGQNHGERAARPL